MQKRDVFLHQASSRFALPASEHMTMVTLDSGGRSLSRSMRSDDSGRKSLPHREPSHRRAERTIPPRILVVDDDESARRGLEALLRGEGFATSTASDAEAALAEVGRAPPDVVVTDLHMGAIDGVELCERLHELDPGLPVILVTGSSDEQSVLRSLRGRAEDYLVKPVELERLLWSVERAITRRASEREHEALRQEIEYQLVASSLRDRAHAEAEARAHAQLTALLGNLSDGVAIADGHGRLLTLNDAGRTILGVEDADLATIPALWAVACDLDGRPLADDEHPLARAARGEHFGDLELLFSSPDRPGRRVVFSGTSVRDDDGEVALAITVFRDVTALRRLEQQREEYLALVSHDLRNPLNGVVGFVSLLKRAVRENGLTEAVRWAERADANAKRMTAMLDELTDATNLEARRHAAPPLVPRDLGKLVADVVDGLEDARGGRVVLAYDGASPHVVLADAARLERVVGNLLTNALKYSPDDALVDVRLARIGGEIELAVTDRGIGIAAESTKRIFDRYYRTAGGKTRASGLGLGLYIASEIAAAHGGRIEVVSELGKGSTFKLILPSHAASA